jgi:putative endopeptidase
MILSRVLKTLLACLVFFSAGALAQDFPRGRATTQESERESRSRFDLRLLDRSASPCSDFYQFACGGWLKSHPIPPEYGAWGRLAQASQENREVLLAIVESASKETNPRDEAIRTVGAYYSACTDEAAAEKLGLSPVEPLLSRIGGLETPKSVVLEAGRRRREGVHSLFILTSTPDGRDARKVIVEVDQGGLGLPDREDYLHADEPSERLKGQYREHLKRIFVLAGDTEDAAAGEANRVWAIETALARGSQTLVERRDPEKLSNRMSMEALTKLAPSIPWAEYFRASGLGPVDAINVASPGYFRALDKLLKTASLADWKSYLRWTVLKEHAPRLTSAFVKENFHFYGSVLRGATALQPRAMRCVAAVEEDLPGLVGRLYTQAGSLPAAKKRAALITGILERTFESDLAKIEWMDEPTRSRAREKLKGVVNRIAFPEAWPDLSALRVASDSWPANAARAASFQFDREIETVGKRTDRTEWRGRVTATEASTNPRQNAITIPAGLIHPPFYDFWIDDAVNFGALGTIIGRRLADVVIGSGSRFDSEGNLKNWWSDRSVSEFQKRAGCVQKQFSQYSAVDGPAEFAGLKIGYRGFEEAVRGVRDRMPSKLSGFTPEQRFFISFAQSRCEAVRPEEQRLRASTESAAPASARVNGPLSNMREFRQAFECPEGTPMARKAIDSCEAW